MSSALYSHELFLSEIVSINLSISCRPSRDGMHSTSTQKPMLPLFVTAMGG